MKCNSAKFAHFSLHTCEIRFCGNYFGSINERLTGFSLGWWSPYPNELERRSWTSHDTKWQISPPYQVSLIHNGVTKIAVAMNTQPVCTIVLNTYALSLARGRILIMRRGGIRRLVIMIELCAHLMSKSCHIWIWLVSLFTLQVAAGNKKMTLE